MVQINNITNGRVIKIFRINTTSGRVDFSIYDYGGGLGTLIKNDFATFENLIDFETQIIKTFEEIQFMLAAELEGFSVSSDIQNWTKPTLKLPGVDVPVATTLRVYMPSLVLNEVTNSGNPLDLLIEKQSVIYNGVQKLENGSHQYLFDLTDADKEILEGYENEGVVIEYKI